MKQFISFKDHPSQLWIGSQQVLLPQIEHMLQQQFCTQGGCTYCTECFKVRTHQHHAIMWVNPEGAYTRDHIDSIMQAICYQLSDEERFFFVLQNADFLTDSCANALLKALEEPPQGYHFLLLAARKHMVLPTIRSRCILEQVGQYEYAAVQQPLFDHFTHTKTLTAAHFISTLDKSDINEKDSVELIDALLVYWNMCVRTALLDDNNERYARAKRILRTLIASAEKPLMPGSSKLFWKHLFLHI